MPYILSLRSLVHVCAVLVAVKPHAEGPLLARQLWLGLRALLDYSSILVEHALDLAASHALKTNLGDEWLVVLDLGACNQGEGDQ